MPTSECRRRATLGLAGLVVAGVLVALYCYDPAGTSVFPTCPFHYLTGLHCPGCGTLRATHNLLHGRLAAAMSLNPLMVVSIPVLGLMLLNPAWVYRRWVPWAVFFVLVAYGIARNIPVWPFILLAPV